MLSAIPRSRSWTIKIDENGFTFKATVAVYPEVKLGEYKGLTAEKEEVKVSADDVKERLNEMAERNARLVSVDRKAKKGDIAVIDFEGFDNGEAFEGGKGENYELELGSGSFVPGFEDQVIGMKAGEEKDLDITFPEDYTRTSPARRSSSTSRPRRSSARSWRSTTTSPRTCPSTTRSRSSRTASSPRSPRSVSRPRRSRSRTALLEKVAGDIKADIPDAMIEEQCRRFLDEFKQRLQVQGIPYDQYCKMTGMNEEKFMEDGKEPAVRQVRMDLAVNAIIKEENLDATDEEVEKKYADLAEKYSMEVGELKKYLDETTVRTEIINEKAITVVVEAHSAKTEKTEGEKRRSLPRRKRRRPPRARRSPPPRRRRRRLPRRRSPAKKLRRRPPRKRISRKPANFSRKKPTA